MAENSNNSQLTTSFNTAPYFDDYDYKKNYYRVLFKPSLAVQTRELNQLQNMEYQQVRRFADHIFNEGSLVTGGQTVLDGTVGYLKLEDTDYLGVNVNVENFRNSYIYSENSGVRAYVIDVAAATDNLGVFEPKTLFVKYVSSGNDNETKTFSPGERLRAEDTNASVTIRIEEDAIGNSLQFIIKEGVLYAKGYFVRFEESKVIAGKYTNKPSCQIGFVVNENIVDYIEDETLKDNANNATNFDAPGADRLQLNPSIKVMRLTDTDPDFKKIYDIEDGIIREKNDKTSYSVIRDELARRTYDESGSYVVRGLQTKVREHLDTGTNFGLYSAEKGGNSSQLAVGVESGLAYVFGYDIETLVTKYVPIRKGLDFQSVEQQVVSANYGSYVVVNEFMGAWDFTAGAIVNLYNTAQARITNNTASTTAPTGTQIGTARVRAVEYAGGDIGTATAQYNVYLYDIKMTNGEFKNVKALYLPQTGRSSGVADVILTNGVSTLRETAFSNGVFPISSSNVKTLRDASGDIDTTFTYMRRFDVNIGTGGTFSLTTSTANDIFPYSIGALNNTQKNEIIVTLNSTVDSAALTGTATINSGTKIVTGTSTNFTNQVSIGDRLKVNGTVVGHVTKINSNTSLEVDKTAGSTLTGAILKSFLPGDIVNMTGRGANAARSINVDTNNSMSIVLGETFASAITGTVICKVNKIDAREIKKNVKKNRFVIIDTGSAGLGGTYNLGISDVFNINYVLAFDSVPTTNTLSNGLTMGYSLDDGQRDNFYDHASIKLATAPTSGQKIVVNLDYFEHDFSQGQGYFSVDSYQIDDANTANTAAIQTAQIPVFVSPTTGVNYSLRDCIDTRPSKVNTASDASTVETASTNPSTTNTYKQATAGLYTVAPNTNFIADLQYYLGRKDLIVINSTGEFRSVTGVPATTAITPQEPSDCMTLAVINIAPYPSLPYDVAKLYNRPQYANSVKQVFNKRYTMRDIGVINQRVNNLEYYTSLSLLEKDTLDMTITDENGLNRFKNGILVDPFRSHKVADYTHPDYAIAIDSTKCEMRPKFELNNIKLKLLNTSGLVNNSGIVTLPFSNKEFISQPYSTTTRNLAGAMYRFVGNMGLNPSEDYWTDTTQAPDLQIDDTGDYAAWQSLADAWGTNWGDWQTIWTGVSNETSVSTTSNNNRGQSSTTTTNTTTTTTSQGQTRSGTQLNVSGVTTTQSYGDRVIDVSLVPYMRARPIGVKATGVKPKTRLYAFFDGENVTEYMVPASPSFDPEGALGDRIVSTENGEVYALFMLPNNTKKKFRTGSKVLRLTDSITNSQETGAVTTSAESTYTAEGLSQTKQSTIVSTVRPQVSVNTVTESQVISSVTTSSSSSTVVTSTPEARGPSGSGGERGGGPDPVAQTFLIDLKGVSAGCFLTQIDLYFKDKDTQYGALVEIREVDANSTLTPWILPYSQVELPPANIEVSEDGTVPTTFKFTAPVYVEDKTEYAIVVKPVADNNNTTLWTAKLGETDIATQTVVNEQPYTGVMYISANDRTWSPIQDEDMKFRLYRAEFTSLTGSMSMSNDDYEFLDISNINGTFAKGELIQGETRVRVTASTVALSNGYQLVGQTSGATGLVSSINTSSGYVYIKDVVGKFVVGEICNVVIAGNISGTTTLSEVIVPTFELELLDGTTAIIRGKAQSLVNTGGQITGILSGAKADITTILNPAMNLIQFEPSYLTFSNTNIEWNFVGTNNAGSPDGSPSYINVKENTPLDDEKMVKSFSNEGGTKSVVFNGAFESFNNYISPLVDLSRSNLIFVKNIINNDATDEDGTNGGEALARYLTNKVTLDEDQDAEDLQVYIGAYRPASTSVKVYYKLLHGEDSTLFDNLEWQEFEESSKISYSAKNNENDFRELKFSIPSSALTGPNEEVQYTNPNGIKFTGFKYFAIKVVLLSGNTSLVPRCKDLRVIALQK
ncbi:hypothetical protein phiOC_p048 [Ochrobactrum phage vB_OspM_OC]|nr:hypothetical protein phiOC_p048 [Ochrobactrum phage vB_OspM_OC]